MKTDATNISRLRNKGASLFSGILTIVVLALIGWLTYGHLFPSETRIICKRLNSMARCISFPAGASTVIRIAGADAARDYFEPDVQVSLENIHSQADFIGNRAEVMNIITLARTHLTELNIQFKDPKVVLAEDKMTANMDVVGQVVINEGRREKIYQLIRIQWNKNDEKKWRIKSVQTLEMLGREEGANYFPPHTDGETPF